MTVELWKGMAFYGLSGQQGSQKFTNFEKHEKYTSYYLPLFKRIVCVKELFDVSNYIMMPAFLVMMNFNKISDLYASQFLYSLTGLVTNA